MTFYRFRVMNKLNLQGLVKKLNKLDKNIGLESISTGMIIYRKTKKFNIKISEVIVIFDFNCGIFHVNAEFSKLTSDVQKIIMTYLSTSHPYDWYAENKYNVVIGYRKVIASKLYVAWYKESDNFNTGWAHEKELNYDEYIFTESEIEELKSTLPESMKEIVELGKVEVKGD